MGPKRYDPNAAPPASAAPAAASSGGTSVPLPRSRATVTSTKIAPSDKAPRGAAAAASTAQDEPASFSQSGSSNVVQWLAAKAAQQKVATTGGALEYLKAQKVPAAAVATAPAPAAAPQHAASVGVDLAAWAKSTGIKATVVAETSTPPPQATAATATAAPAAQQQPPTQILKPLPRSAQANPPPLPPQSGGPIGSQLTQQQGNRKVRQSKAGNQQRPTPAAAIPAAVPASAAAAAAQQQQQQPGVIDEIANSPGYQQWMKQQQDAVHAHAQIKSRILAALSNQESAAAAVAAGRQLQRLDLAQIVDVIEAHDVTIVCTDTGSGKSTAIPNALLDRDPNNRIVTTQPRRTATISIAQHVAQQREQIVGDEVGYWIRGEKRGKESTRLWYMTSYTLLLQLLGCPLKPPYTHIILDEFHERQPDIEVTAALLKLCLEHKTAPFKLVLMSATLNVDDWLEYFKGLSVAVYRQSAPEHPIHDFFLEDACALVGLQSTPPAPFVPPVVDHHQVEGVMFVCQHLIMNLNSISAPHQSMLVFLPGRAQVEEFVLWAETVLSRTAEAIPWHSAVDLGHIQDSIGRRATTRQKIYFATDIAEVSITLPDVVFVIDSGLVKRPTIVPHEPATILYPPLNTQYISQGSIAQRRGRVGRTQQGFYFSLISITLVPLLSRLPPAPIQNARIDELALHSLQLASNPVAVFSICRAQPLLQSIITSMRSLTEYGCIINTKDPVALGEGVNEMFNVEHGWSPLILQTAKALIEDADIDEYGCTFIGRLLQLMPVSMQQGMLVFYGLLTGLESLMMLAAACANSLMPFTVNMKAMQDMHRGGGGGGRGGRGGGNNVNMNNRRNGEMMGKAMEATEDAMRMASQGTHSDLVAVMEAALRFRIQQLMPGASETSLQMWCLANQLSYEKILAIVELDQHIKFEMAGFIPFRDLDDPTLLLQQLHQFRDIVITAACAAFASQAQQVVTMGGGQKQYQQRESAVGLFTELKSLPDLHAPSSFRWELDDIIVPVCINLRYSHTLVSYSTLVKSPKRFYLSLLLFSHRLKYDCFEDGDGKYYEFSVTFHGKTRYFETDADTGAAILDFRQRLARICTTIRLRYAHKLESEQQFDQQTLAQYGIPPLFMQQREIMVALMHYFFGEATFNAMTVLEVEHGDSDLTRDSMLAFHLPE